MTDEHDRMGHMTSDKRKRHLEALNADHLRHDGLPCNADCGGLGIRQEALADAEVAWRAWASREYGLPVCVPPENAAPLLEVAFRAGYLAGKGIEG